MGAAVTRWPWQKARGLSRSEIVAGAMRVLQAQHGLTEDQSLEALRSAKDEINAASNRAEIISVMRAAYRRHIEKQSI